MTAVKELLPASAALTITLANLATSAVGVGRSSAAVSNGSDLYEDVLIEVLATLTTGTISTSGPSVDVYGYASLDGSGYSEGVAGTDSGYTIGDPSALPRLGTIPFSAQSQARRSRPLSIAAAFGFVPAKFGIVVVNNTGIALAGSGNAAIMLGLHHQVV